MDWELLVAAFTGAALVAGETMRRLSGRTVQQELLDSYSVLEQMAEGVHKEEARRALDQRAFDMARASETRDAAGISLALGFVMGATVFTYLADDRESVVFWIIAAVLWLFGFVGLGISLPKAHRDEKGNRIEPRSTPPVESAPSPETEGGSRG